MAGTTKVSKKLPKRVTNQHRQETRRRSYEEGKVRKAERRAEQQKREKVNIKLLDEGKPNAWEASNGWTAGTQVKRRWARRENRLARIV